MTSGAPDSNGPSSSVLPSMKAMELLAMDGLSEA
jgi:hypothetical protein